MAISGFILPSQLMFGSTSAMSLAQHLLFAQDNLPPTEFSNAPAQPRSVTNTLMRRTAPIVDRCLPNRFDRFIPATKQPTLELTLAGPQKTVRRFAAKTPAATNMKLQIELAKLTELRTALEAFQQSANAFVETFQRLQASSEEITAQHAHELLAGLVPQCKQALNLYKTASAIPHNQTVKDLMKSFEVDLNILVTTLFNLLNLIIKKKYYNHSLKYYLQPIHTSLTSLLSLTILTEKQKENITHTLAHLAFQL